MKMSFEGYLRELVETVGNMEDIVANLLPDQLVDLSKCGQGFFPAILGIGPWPKLQKNDWSLNIKIGRN